MGSNHNTRGVRLLPKEEEQMIEYSYQIDPRPADLGGGWRLRLLENGEEVGGGVFPDYDDALAEATVWLASRPD